MAQKSNSRPPRPKAAERPLPNSDEGAVVYAQLGPCFGIWHTRQQLRSMMAQGTFPAALQLSGSRIAWRLGDVREWLRSRPMLVRTNSKAGSVAHG